MTGSAQLSPAQFPAALLQALGLPTSQVWQDVINVWVQAEGGYNATKSGGAAVNNPLNTNCDWPGATGCVTLSNGAKVASYASLQDAVNSYATGGSINNFSSWKNAGTPFALANDISSSNWASSGYKQYSITTNAITGQNLTLTGLSALLYKNATNKSQFLLTYAVAAGNQNQNQGNPVSDAGAAATNAAGGAAGAAGGAIGAAQTALTAGQALTSWVTNFLASPNLAVNAIVLLTGLIMLVLGLKSLVGQQAGQAITILGGADASAPKGMANLLPNTVTPNTVTGTVASPVTADSPVPASESFTLPEFLKQVSTSESQSYSPETPRAKEPSKSALRHRERRAQDRAAIAAFSRAPAEAMV